MAATSALALIAAALAQPAAAQDDGVFFDPGGPSEKEYALPHDQARSGGGAGSPDQGGGSGTASPSGGSATQDGQAQGASPDGESPDASLFGEGVSRAEHARRADGGAGTGGGETDVGGLSPTSAEPSPATGLGWFAAIAAGVALLGGGLAYLIRARPRGAAS